MKEKNCRVYKTCQKNKIRTAKVHSKIDRSKEKEIEERRWRVYTLFLQRLVERFKWHWRFKFWIRIEMSSEKKESFVNERKRIRNKYREKKYWRDKNILYFNQTLNKYSDINETR